MNTRRVAAQSSPLRAHARYRSHERFCVEQRKNLKQEFVRKSIHIDNRAAVIITSTITLAPLPAHDCSRT